MKYHNLDVVIKNLEIFKQRYILIRTIKVNQKRGIYSVIDTVDNKKKVLKFIIKSSIIDEQRDIFRFFMTCQHPNFCKIDSTFEIGLFFVLVMNQIEGDTMCSYFEKDHNRINYYKILFDLIFSLDYLHNNRIVHGDIKPNNIIIKPDGTPIIIDYDLSRFANGDRFTKRIFGTKFFMSPELVIENKFSAKSDIWSLGMTLYVCIMKTYIPNILENIPSIDDTIMMGDQKLSREREIICYVNQTVKNVFGSIAKNHQKIKNVYGKLFTNTISIMLVENAENRPSSEQLSQILQKSKYFPLLYDQNVGSDHIRHSIDSCDSTRSKDLPDDESIEPDPEIDTTMCSVSIKINTTNTADTTSNNKTNDSTISSANSMSSNSTSSLTDSPMSSNESLELRILSEHSEQKT